MTRITLTSHTQDTHTAASTWTGRIAAHVGGGWRWFMQRRLQKATVVSLQSLDDRTLNDIGLKRSEIESVVNAKATGRRQRYVDIGGVVSRG